MTFESAGDRFSEFVVGNWLAEEVRSALFHGAHDIDGIGRARNHDDRQLWIELTNLAQCFDAVTIGHHDVQQNGADLSRAGAEIRKHLFAVLGHLDRVPEAFQRHLKVSANFQFVFADENRRPPIRLHELLLRCGCSPCHCYSVVQHAGSGERSRTTAPPVDSRPTPGRCVV